MSPTRNKKHAILVNVIGLFIITGTSASINWAEIDGLAEDFRAGHDIPGLGLVLVNRTNDQVFAKGFGQSDIGNDVPVQNNTRFLIASISKSFTAITVCRALHEKFPELDRAVLDIPIVRLAPTYNLTLIDRYRTTQATFRDLLSHRMCLSSYGQGVTMGAYASRADRLYRYRYTPQVCGFRARWEYSSAMFVLAGDILAHIIGAPFDDLVMELLRDIEMTDSLIVSPTEDYETLEGMSRGYFYNLDGELTKMNARIYNSHSGAASGGIISTAADMGKYILFHLKRGRVQGQQVVPENVMEWLYEPSSHVPFTGHWNQMEPAYRPEGILAYGLGLDLGHFDGWLKVAHRGDLSPFTSQITMYPDMGVGIFTAINGPGPLTFESNHVQVHDAITLSLLGSTKHMGPIKSGKISKSHTKLPLLSPYYQIMEMERNDPSLLAGLYGHPYEGDILVNYNGTSLEFQYGIWGKGSLRDAGIENVYEVVWEGDIISILLGYSGGPPLAKTRFDFSRQGVLTYADTYARIEYTRDGTIDTYPEIPWEDGSCGRTI